MLVIFAQKYSIIIALALCKFVLEMGKILIKHQRPFGFALFLVYLAHGDRCRSGHGLISIVFHVFLVVLFFSKSVLTDHSPLVGLIQVGLYREHKLPHVLEVHTEHENNRSPQQELSACSASPPCIRGAHVLNNSASRQLIQEHFPGLTVKSHFVQNCTKRRL